MAADSRIMDRATLIRLLLDREPQIRSYVISKVPTRVRGLVAIEDVLQEIWIAAFRGIGKFKPDRPDAFDRWLITLANHKLLDLLKSVLADKRGGQSYIMGGLHHRQASLSGLFTLLQSPQSTPSGEVSVKEATSAVQVAMSGLREDRRQAIWMRHIEGREISEIAAALDKSESAVHNLLNRGRKELRKRLGGSSKYFTDTASSIDLVPGLRPRAAAVAVQ